MRRTLHALMFALESSRALANVLDSVDWSLCQSTRQQVEDSFAQCKAHEVTVAEQQQAEADRQAFIASARAKLDQDERTAVGI